MINDDFNINVAATNLPVPSSCTAKCINDAQIDISWTIGSVSGIKGFIVEYSTNDGQWQRLHTATSTERAWSYRGSGSYNKYRFRVCSYWSDNNGLNYTQSAFATSSVVYTTPSTVSNFSATYVSDSQINLKWTNGKYYTSIALDRRVEGEETSFSRLKDLSATTTSYSDTTVSSNNKYTYQIKGWNGLASFGKTVTVYTKPSAPTSCKATKLSNTSIQVTWVKGANYTNTWQNVYLERQIDGGSWSQAASLSWTVSSWTDTDVSFGHKYMYRVRSHNTSGYSGYTTSNTIQMGQTIHAYNSSGQVKVGIVTAYDSSGKLHQVKITAYDSSGKAHNVQ